MTPSDILDLMPQEFTIKSFIEKCKLYEVTPPHSVTKFLTDQGFFRKTGNNYTLKSSNRTWPMSREK